MLRQELKNPTDRLPRDALKHVSQVDFGIDDDEGVRVLRNRLWPNREMYPNNGTVVLLKGYVRSHRGFGSEAYFPLF